MLVKDVMRRDVVTVKRSTTLGELMEIFQKYTFHTVPVLEGKKLVGIVELEHLLRIFQPHPQHIQEMLKRVPFLEEEERNFFELEVSPEMAVLCVVDDIMEVKFPVIDDDAEISEFRRLTKLYKIQKLPVIDKERELVGIISLFDIIMALFKEKGIL